MTKESFELQFSLFKENKLIKFFEEVHNIQSKLNLEFEQDGLHMSLMDQCNSVLLNLNVNKDEFNFYSLKGRSSFVIGLEVNEFIKCIKCAKNETLIKFFYYSGVPDWLKINTKYNQDGSINHKLRLLDISSMSLEIKTCEYAITFRYNMKELYETINKLLTKNNTYTVIAKINGDIFSLIVKVEISHCGFSESVFKSFFMLNPITFEQFSIVNE